MFSFVLSFLTPLLSKVGPYLTYLKVLLVALLISALVALGFTTNYYKTKYEAEISTVATSSQKLLQSDTNLKTCSDNIKALSDESAKKIKESSDALEAAKNNTKKYKVYSNSLLSATPSSKDDCQSAVDLFHQYFLTIKSREEIK